MEDLHFSRLQIFRLTRGENQFPALPFRAMASFNYQPLPQSFQPQFDFQVQTGTTANSTDRYVLKDVLGRGDVGYVGYSSPDGDVTDIFGDFQPTDTSWGSMTQGSERVPHIQTATPDPGSYLYLVPPLDMGTNDDWTFSFAGSRLVDSTGTDIILGPAGRCECQVRYENGNTLGFYGSNNNGGWNEAAIPLSSNVNQFHVITMSHDSATDTLKIFQNSNLVATVNRNDDFAKLGAIASWFSGQNQAKLAIHRMIYLNEPVFEDRIEEFVDIISSQLPDSVPPPSAPQATAPQAMNPQAPSVPQPPVQSPSDGTVILPPSSGRPGIFPSFPDRDPNSPGFFRPPPAKWPNTLRGRPSRRRERRPPVRRRPRRRRGKSGGKSGKRGYRRRRKYQRPRRRRPSRIWRPPTSSNAAMPTSPTPPPARRRPNILPDDYPLPDFSFLPIFQNQPSRAPTMPPVVPPVADDTASAVQSITSGVEGFFKSIFDN